MKCLARFGHGNMRLFIYHGACIISGLIWGFVIVFSLYLIVAFGNWNGIISGVNLIVAFGIHLLPPNLFDICTNWTSLEQSLILVGLMLKITIIKKGLI